MADFLNGVSLSSGSNPLKTGGAIAIETVGNTVSDLLGLDTIADSSMVAGDTTRGGEERAWAAAKGIGVTALDVAGGAILKGAGGLVAKVPGAAALAKAVSASKIGTSIASAAGREVSLPAAVGRVSEAVKTSAAGRFLRRDVETFLPGGRSPAEEVSRLAEKAEELRALLDDWAGTRRTSAVMSTRGGPDISAGGLRNLTDAQKTLAIGRGDLVGSLTNRRIELLNEAGAGLPLKAHAEVTAFYEALRNGLRPRAVAVTPAKFCPGQCASWVPSAGADVLSSYTGYWFSTVPFSNYIPLGSMVPSGD